MKKLVTAISAIAFAGALAGGSAMAKVDEPGTPGEANCEGQTTAWIASTFGGLGKLAKEEGLSVQEIHEIIAAICAGE
jgi:hypothetical protein